LYQVIGLAHLKDPEGYASGSVATVRVFLAGQDEGERSDKERYAGPPGWGLRRWTSTPTLGKIVTQLKTIYQSLGLRVDLHGNDTGNGKGL
jgi:hypothetical protein